MKKSALIFFIFCFYGCHTNNSNSHIVIKGNIDSAKHNLNHIKATNKSFSAWHSKYNRGELLNFLDSLGHISMNSIVDSINDKLDLSNHKWYPVDTPESKDNLSIIISDKDFSILRVACKTHKIKKSVAKRLFPNLKFYDSINVPHTLYLDFISFDKAPADFKYFAVAFYPYSPDSNCGEDRILYFFSSNKLIARHYNFFRFNPDIHCFNDSDGNIIVYYPECFDEGAGICWFQDYFYKYINGKLLPVLNIIKGTNLEEPGDIPRWYTMNSKILNFEPLTVQYKRTVSLGTRYYDTDEYEIQESVVNDSIVVRYYRDVKTQKYYPKYPAGLNDEMIASYYCQEDSNMIYEYLFANSNYSLLQKLLKSKNDTLQRVALIYADTLKSYLQSTHGKF